MFTAINRTSVGIARCFTLGRLRARMCVGTGGFRRRLFASGNNHARVRDDIVAGGLQFRCRRFQLESSRAGRPTVVGGAAGTCGGVRRPFSSRRSSDPAAAAADLVMRFPVFVLAERAAVASNVTAATRLRRLAAAVPTRLSPTNDETH